MKREFEAAWSKADVTLKIEELQERGRLCSLRASLITTSGKLA